MKYFLNWNILFLVATTPISAHAWNSHDFITKEALSDRAELRAVVDFGPVETVLSSLTIRGVVPKTRAELCRLLNINENKIEWSKTSKIAPDAISVLMEANMETDRGMDQDLDISADQVYMGGFSGHSSQAIRHMYYEEYDFLKPILTLHYPFKQMGFANERAQTFFDLAVQAKRAGHLYWAYRFLGYGLHYVQDVTQPYHTNQFGSLRLLPWKVLISKGWLAFVADTTRIVANFHISFEDYVDGFFTRHDNEAERVVVSLRAPVGDQVLKVKLDQNTGVGVGSGTGLSISNGVVDIAEASAELVRPVVAEQLRLYGDRLLLENVNYLEERKIDMLQMQESDRTGFVGLIQNCLSNAGVASRWYLERFLRS